MERLFPDLRHDAAIGAVRYWDAAVDDARLVETLVRTAVSLRRARREPHPGAATADHHRWGR